MEQLFGLYPEKKRRLKMPYLPEPLSMLKRNHHSTPAMYTKDIVLDSHGAGYPSDNINGKNSKLHGLFPNSFNSFQSTPKGVAGSFPHRIFIPQHFHFVGGFLGSKSQNRSESHNLRTLVWDFIKLAEEFYCCLDDIVAEEEKNSTTSSHNNKQEFSSYENKKSKSDTSSAPPTKKIAKETAGEEPVLAFSIAAECSLPRECVAEGPKQSYAEVAKAAIPTSRRSRAEVSSSGAYGDQYSHKQPYQTKLTSGRKNTRCRRKDSPARKPSVGRNSSVAPCTENFEVIVKGDSRTRHQSVHPQFGAVQHSPGAYSHRRQRRKNIERNKNPCGSKTGRVAARCAPLDSVPDRHFIYDRKGSRLNSTNSCDIGMVNWRTGEPIKMNGGCGTDTGFSQTNKYISKGSENMCYKEDMDSMDCDKRRERVCSESSSSATSSGSELQLPLVDGQRRSFSSECSVDSDDSFIVFQTGGSCVRADSLSDLSDECSDWDSDSVGSDSDVLSECDSYDGVACTPPSQFLQEINDRWQREFEDKSKPLDEPNEDVPSKRKKVHFSPSKPRVHTMVMWDYAYRKARIGPWEQMYRDRSRFHERIKKSEAVISPVLSPQHRAQIWNLLYT